MKKLYQNEIFVIFTMCLFQGIFLLYAISNLSISYYEAEIFYDKKSLVSLIANLSCEIFGRNDYALRVSFILIHFANAAMISSVHGERLTVQPTNLRLRISSHAVIHGRAHFGFSIVPTLMKTSRM